MDEQDVAPKRVPVPGKSRGGEWVPIGDELYRIPPLSLLSIQELGEDVSSLATMGKVPTPAQMSVVVRIVHSAMKRNYPDLPEDELKEMLDVGNYQRVLAKVLSIAGYEREGESGEAPASTGPKPTPP